MLKFGVVLLTLQFLILGAVAENSDQTIQSIYSKFKQSDYNITIEWFELARYKKPEITYLKLTTFKYNRTCPAVNFTYSLNLDFGYELEVIVQGYRFSNNEYRLFPLRFEVNACKAMTSNIGGIGGFIKCGNFTGCPVNKGTFHVCNWTPDQSNFPPFIPSGRYMWELQGMYREKELWVVRVNFAIVRSVLRN